MITYYWNILHTFFERQLLFKMVAELHQLSLKHVYLCLRMYMQMYVYSDVNIYTHTHIYIFDIYTYRSSSGGSLGSSSQSKHPTNQIPLHSPQSLRQRCQRCFPPRCKAVSPQDDRRKFRSQTSDNMDR